MSLERSHRESPSGEGSLLYHPSCTPGPKDVHADHYHREGTRGITPSRILIDPKSLKWSIVKEGESVKSQIKNQPCGWFSSSILLGGEKGLGSVLSHTCRSAGGQRSVAGRVLRRFSGRDWCGAKLLTASEGRGATWEMSANYKGTPKNLDAYLKERKGQSRAKCGTCQHSHSTKNPPEGGSYVLHGIRWKFLDPWIVVRKEYESVGEASSRSRPVKGCFIQQSKSSAVSPNFRSSYSAHC